MRFILLATTVLYLGPSLYAQSSLLLTPSQLKALDSIATQDVPPRAPGIATCIVHKGMVVYEKYAGYADLTDSSLITRNTRFNLASNGKQFTAIAIATLIEQGRLRLDDDIRTYLPTLYKRERNKITIQHLLTHTSGIRDVYDLWSLQGITWWKHTYSNKDAVSLLQRQQDLNFLPGTDYLYSNSNYILLAQIIEQVSGTPFDLYMKNLFRHLGMTATSFEPDYTKIRGPIARSYFNFSTWTTYGWIWNVQGDGNLFSTMTDQIQWEKLLYTRQSPHVSKELFSKSQQPVDSTFKNYGYGLEFSSYKGMPYIFHEGATGAWKATVVRFPQQQLSIITFTNSGKAIPSMQTRQMADVILGNHTQKEQFLTSPAKTDAFVTPEETTGVYQTENGFTFEIEIRESSLFLRRTGRNDIRLVRESANVFHQWNDPAFKQEFNKNAKGEMQVTAYYTTHAPYTLTRPSVNWEGYSFQALNGQYYNEETGVSLDVRYIDKRNYEVEINGKKRKSILISPKRMIIGNYVLDIESAPGIQSPSFFLSTDRIRNVRFIKKSSS